MVQNTGRGWPALVDVYVSSIGMTRFGKRDEGLLELMVLAAEQALEGKHVDALFVGCQNPEEFCGLANISTRVASELGHAPRPAVRIENSSASGAAAFMSGVIAIMSGLCESVLVVAGEKMTGVDTPRAQRILTEILTPDERSYGLTMAGLCGMIAKRYMHENGLTREDLALIPVKNHHNATLNPLAHFHKEITVEDVLASRMVADPLRMYDCAPISDGAAAAVISSHGGDVEVAGFGQGTETMAVVDRGSLLSFRANTEAARMAFHTAGLRPSDVNVAEIHEAFSILELINSEDIGLFRRGESWKAMKKGETQLNGRLPINTSGGHKARGHPVGGSGMAQICEIFLQLTGNAGKRQVDGAKVGLTHNMGGFACNNIVTILKGNP
jgi:acetyl-CoA acetyltransferase